MRLHRRKSSGATTATASSAEFHSPFYGESDKSMVFETCGSEDCLLHFARHHLWDAPLMCGCPQREYPHEISIHSQLKHEAYNPKLRWQWPWSLVLSHREEPASTERKVA